jgi:hypothetical protein
VILLGTTSAAPADRTVTVAVGTATLEIPTAWDSLPTHRLRMKALFGPGSDEYLSMSHWTDAFRPRPDEDGDRFPVIVVEVYETGRLSWASFSATVREAESMKVNGGEGPDPFTRALLESSWSLDEAGRRFYTESAFDAPGGMPITISSMTVLTERGTITIHGITRTDGPAEDRDTVDRVQLSLTVDAEVAYRWRPSDWLDVLNGIDLRVRLGVAGALVFCGLLIGLRVFRIWNRPT